MTVSQKRCDDEFKRNCVEMLLSGGRPLKPLAASSGSRIRRSGAGATATFSGRMGPRSRPRGATPREMAEEIRRLRKDLDRVTRQREILKKALGILSDQSPAGMP